MRIYTKRLNKLFVIQIIILISFMFILIFVTYETKSKELKTINNNFLNKIPFEYSLNPGRALCQNVQSRNELLFISLVLIAPHLFEKRNQIRNTWANKQFYNDLRNMFVIGLSKNETVNRLIREEFDMHQDLLQIENLTDSYHVINIKIMKSFKWISTYCSNAKYILRICDDVIVNTPKLINDFRHDSFYKYKENKMFGMTLSGVGPDHNPSSKWYVSVLEFNKTYPAEYNGVYPRYPQGTFLNI